MTSPKLSSSAPILPRRVLTNAPKLIPHDLGTLYKSKIPFLDLENKIYNSPYKSK